MNHLFVSEVSMNQEKLAKLQAQVRIGGKVRSIVNETWTLKD